MNPKNYWRTALQMLNATLLDRIDVLASPAAERMLPHVPIFIIGAPRSGSTLLFQALTDAFDVGYLTNRHCQYFGSPRLCEQLFRPLKNKRNSSFSSHHGSTEGWDAPSECGAWWYRFFPRDPAYVEKDHIDIQDMRRFRRSLAGFVEAAARPVIFKNLYASLRLNAIGQHIPEALYIWVVRDEVANAHSILEAKFKDLGSYEPWWSVPLPNIDELNTLDAAPKALAQVRGINNLIQDSIDAGIVPDHAVFKVTYEEFCQNTKQTLDDFLRFVEKNNHKLSRRFDIPESFHTNDQIRIPKALYEKLQSAAQDGE